MKADAVTIIGFAAAFLTTASFLPQVVRTWRTRAARDLSLPMFLMLSTGLALWLLYGILLGRWPLILANGAGLTGALTILYFKLRFG
jgi:MtN3 and saliva related transmembrane protein